MLLKYLGICGSKNASSPKKHYPTIVQELCHQFSLQDLRKSTNNFDRKRLIGRGAFSYVYKGYVKDDGATGYAIALKRFSRDHKNCFQFFVREIELLCQLRHPNLMSPIGFCNDEKALERLIVYEIMPNGSLSHYLRSEDMEPLTWKKRLQICVGVARGLHYLHAGAKRTIIHRDIKPLHILLDNNMVPKLHGFQLSIQGPLSTSKPKPIAVDHLAGTVGYLAPECLIDNNFVSDKSDVYSFGMVLLEVVCTKDSMIVIKASKLAHQQFRESRLGQEFNHGNSLSSETSFPQDFPIEETIDPILEGKIAPDCWQVFIDIMERCLKREPEERPTIGEVEVLLEHALSLQEQADITNTHGDYTLLSSTLLDFNWMMKSD